jgi:hypothetical protein
MVFRFAANLKEPGSLRLGLTQAKHQQPVVRSETLCCVVLFACQEKAIIGFLARHRPMTRQLLSDEAG